MLQLRCCTFPIEHSSPFACPPLRTHTAAHSYIIAAIELYLDVINLFQYLLMLLAVGNTN